MKTITVQAKADHIASLANATPLSAIEELVWNALDADAREVKVDLVTNPLGAVDAVRVSDDGAGIDIARVDDTFGSLGGSWKRADGVTHGLHRRLHGRRGRGRFKAFAIGLNCEWRTTLSTPDGLKSYILAGDAANPGVFSLDETSPGPGTGTEVYITNVRPSADVLTDAGAVVSALAATFAVYLKAYPAVQVYFCGIPVTPVIVQKSVTDYNVSLPTGEEAKLEVIEWRRRFVGAGRLVFCGGDGFALRERPAGVRPGAAFSFTAYLRSPRFDELEAQNALVLDELNPEVRGYLDAARRILRDHFKVRAAQDNSARLASWIADGSYPFPADDTSPARERFDAAVADLRAHMDGFDALPSRERRYLFGLLLKTIPAST